MMSQRLIELRHQREIVENWLDTPGIPGDVHTKLRTMLNEIIEEMSSLRAPDTHLGDSPRPAI